MLSSKMLKSSSQSSKMKMKKRNSIFSFTTRTITITPTPSSSHRIKQSLTNRPSCISQTNSSHNFMINSPPIFNDNSNIERALSPKSRQKLRQIFLRYQENSKDQKPSSNCICNDITEYTPITTKTINHRNLFRAKASAINKPYYTIENKSSSPYSNYRCTSIGHQHQHQHQHHHYEEEQSSVNSNRNTSARKDAFSKRMEYGHLVTAPNKAKIKGRNELVKSNRTVPINNLFSQMNNDKRIKAKIKQLKDFKFSVDYKAYPDKEKHQQTIENNLTLLNEIKQTLENNIESRKNNTNDEDESISIDGLND